MNDMTLMIDKLMTDSREIIENDRDMVLAVLKGERPTVTEDGEEVARVTWERVKLIEGVGK